MNRAISVFLFAAELLLFIALFLFGALLRLDSFGSLDASGRLLAESCWKSGFAVGRLAQEYGDRAMTPGDGALVEKARRDYR